MLPSLANERYTEAPRDLTELVAIRAQEHVPLSAKRLRHSLESVRLIPNEHIVVLIDGKVFLGRHIELLLAAAEFLGCESIKFYSRGKPHWVRWFEVEGDHWVALTTVFCLGPKDELIEVECR